MGQRDPACYALSMSYEPDILVVERGFPEIRLVVEVKGDQSEETFDQAVRHLASFMSKLAVPAGLVLTPVRLGVVVNEFRNVAGGPSTLVEDLRVPNAPWFRGTTDPDEATAPGRPELELEDRARRWLESLFSGARDDSLPEGVRRAIDRYVRPALQDAEVRAARPRWRQSA